jgi:hypothetical protein
MRRRPAASALRRRFNAMAIVAAIAVFSVLAGTGASYAYWSANASRTVNSTTGNVQVTVSGFTAGQIQNHVKQTVGYVTVTNTTVQNASSTTPATLSLTVGAGGGNAFATAAGVVVWPAAGNSSANCTLAATTPGSQSGSWSPGVTITGSLAKGASAIYCVRTTVAIPVDAGSASGTTSFAATVSATLSVHNFTGTASMAPTMSTAHIYPLGSPTLNSWMRLRLGSTTGRNCLDVSGSGGAGTVVIQWGCHANPNQKWRITSVAGTDYVRLAPQHADTTRLAATSTNNGADITIQAANTSNTLQDWQFQQSGTGRYQLVNRATGYCLTSQSLTADVGTAMTQTPCNSSDLQWFLPDVSLSNFACTASTTGTDRNLSLSWGSTTGTFTLWIDGVATSSTVGGTNTGLTRTIAQGSYPAGSHSYEVRDANGVAVGSGQFTMTNETYWILWPLYQGTRLVLTGCTP